MYIIFLIVGLGFLIISVVMGELLELEGAHLSFLRPSIIAAVLAVTGAMGTFMGDSIPRLLLLPVSVGVGLLIGFLLSAFIINPLHRAQSTSTVEQKDLIGMQATVDSKIAQGGFGRIIYTVNGSRVSSPARSITGTGFETGTAVEITDIQEGVYYVRAVIPEASQAN